MKLFLTSIGLLFCITTAQAETLNWTANSVATSYKVYHRLSNDSNYGPSTDVGNVTTFQTGLLSPGTHVFAIASVNATGQEGKKSLEVSKYIMPPPDPRLSVITALCKALGATC